MLFWNAVPTATVLQYFVLLTVLGSSIPSGTPTVPSPICIPPSENFDGNDGPWSSFFMRVGTPAQVVSVLVSTAGNQPWVVLPQGCTSSDPSNCVQSRGDTFAPNASSTWVKNNLTAQGTFVLAIETNLGLTGNGLYGYDTVALSYQGSIGVPSLNHQIVAGITAPDFWMGMFGLNPAATNFSSYNNPQQSYLSSMKSQSLIPSLSYGFTAGNQYRFNKVWGSLTLGGYDSAIFEPNELTIPVTPIGGFPDFIIEVDSITISSHNGNQSLSNSSFSAYVDSSVASLYLPVEVCERFEDAFGITYDSQTGLYLVNDTLHNQLLNEAANVTFTLTNVTAQVKVDIILPYQAFDLVADWPLVPNATRYFPLKRSDNSTQNTLGRTFLQEAYVIADYERYIFSMYQRKWDANLKPDIKSILPLRDDAKAQSNSHPKVSITIIVASTVGGLLLFIVAIGFFIIIRQRNQKLKALKEKSWAEFIKQSVPPSSATGTTVCELDAVDTMILGPEMDARVISEMPANEAIGFELYSPKGKGKTLSLRQRELEYNRNALRQEQFTRRREFLQDEPQFMFGSMAQTMATETGLPLSPQFQTLAWNSSPVEGRTLLERTLSSPALSSSQQIISNPEGHEHHPNGAGNSDPMPGRSKFGSI